MIIIKIIINNEEKEVNLLNDYLFTKVFGEIGCDRETLYLTNTFTGKNFKTLRYEQNEIKGKYEGNKKSIVDVLVTMNDKTIVSIESQIGKQKKFHKRTHHYSTKIHSIFLTIGEDYENLPMIIMINFLDFSFHPLEDYHLIFTQTEKTHKEYSIEDLAETHYIEIPKFRKQVKKGNIDLNDPKIRLMLLLDKETPQNLIEKVIKMDEYANNIYEKAKLVLKNQKQYLAYIRAEQAEQDQKAMLKYAEEKGEEKGKEEGRIEGKEEEKIETAKRLKDMDFSIEDVAKATNLTIEIIKTL